MLRRIEAVRFKKKEEVISRRSIPSGTRQTRELINLISTVNYEG